ncbi:hypothetical protein MHBO_000012 [Bonamia ostreae]|uniref:Uncharacterized protein n=1 Tax=Bonamia ostreae TaxID=126728 RepID=A0ABV2ADY4_9EUKA
MTLTSDPKKTKTKAKFFDFKMSQTLFEKMVQMKLICLSRLAIKSKNSSTFQIAYLPGTNVNDPKVIAAFLDRLEKAKNNNLPVRISTAVPSPHKKAKFHLWEHQREIFKDLSLKVYGNLAKVLVEKLTLKNYLQIIGIKRRFPWIKDENLLEKFICDLPQNAQSFVKKGLDYKVSRIVENLLVLLAKMKLVRVKSDISEDRIMVSNNCGRK